MYAFSARCSVSNLVFGAVDEGAAEDPNGVGVNGVAANPGEDAGGVVVGGFVGRLTSSNMCELVAFEIVSGGADASMNIRNSVLN
jgi:hypothetical protein